MQSLLATGRFLTRLPLPGDASRDLQLLHLAWFPAVGLAIGALLAGIDFALTSFPWEVRNALVVAAAITITGALHLDALMDTADGLTVSGSESGSIMRSSVHTAEGAATGIAAICLYWMGLCLLQDPLRWQWLIGAPAIGRAAIVFGYRTFTVRSDAGLVTRLLAKTAHTRPATCSVLIVVILAAFLTLPTLTLPTASAFAMTVAVALMFKRMFGALGGDHYGALAVVAEITFILAVATLSRATL